MSKSSIYENSWIDIVFENKNKEYGAYQLRHDNLKTSFTALLMGLLFVASVASVLFFVNKIKNPISVNPVDIPIIDETIHVTKVDLHQEPERAAPVLPTTQVTPPAPITIKSQLVNPVIVKSDLVVADIAKASDNVIPVNQDSSGSGTELSTIPSVGTENGTATTGNLDPGTGIINSNAVDVMPAFPGGIDKFYKYVGTTFRQPDLESDQVFRVYVSFVIEKDGTMTAIKILKDPGFGLGKEAIRVLQSLKTKWSPGIVNSKPVRTAYNLPIIIKAQ
ncbi:energy transducer TonB [Flavobacterium sp. TMP13]|uniref:energy transducer TonB n=1 Tax=Flavobacterium sp. TMP13 TaxID=3425950 RepID=UPI003D779E23